MTKYAATTEVSVAKSKEEIERILTRYGATAFSYGWDGKRAAVRFHAHNKFIQFILPLPDPDDHQFRFGRYNRPRPPAQREKVYEQAQRQVWRALKLVIQAKLEAVDAGITTFEDEFLAHILLPNGQTVGEAMRPQIEEVYANGMPPSGMLALPGGR